MADSDLEEQLLGHVKELHKLITERDPLHQYHWDIEWIDNEDGTASMVATPRLKEYDKQFLGINIDYTVIE